MHGGRPGVLRKMLRVRRLWLQLLWQTQPGLTLNSVETKYVRWEGWAWTQERGPHSHTTLSLEYTKLIMGEKTSLEYYKKTKSPKAKHHFHLRTMGSSWLFNHSNQGGRSGVWFWGWSQHYTSWSLFSSGLGTELRVLCIQGNLSANQATSPATKWLTCFQ